MAHFYALANNGKTKPSTKTGNKSSGIETIAAAWGGAIRTRITHVDGCDRYVVEHIAWPSMEVLSVLSSGIIGATFGKPAPGHVSDVKPGTGKGE
jgi:hypothetical protein